MYNITLNCLTTPTGVKYLHGKAEEYGIRIYFEAIWSWNHIIFGAPFKLVERTSLLQQQKAASKLINQAVGDALSGLLLVEAILQHMGWSVSVDKWNELYHDLPSRQLKSRIECGNDIRRNECHKTPRHSRSHKCNNVIRAEKYPQAGCFVRPSGTEDVVRVYAEANKQEAAAEVAASVAKLVNQFLGLPAS
ncbi:hypothetical protein OSB04_010680 [Centaurea solstitialis]|uniref:Phosphoglucomutase n=1 Tax=Centaurea solstitialis TaxID=347529 RepID=A0AA38TL84_9ASTR|nr:hypothetical protein OSB04_010680 [Centaurea solstitialis]